VRDHRSTIVFTNTRRVAERVAHHLGERLGEDVVRLTTAACPDDASGG
jgi:Lhr-like helicase